MEFTRLTKDYRKAMSNKEYSKSLVSRLDRRFVSSTIGGVTLGSINTNINNINMATSALFNHATLPLSLLLPTETTLSIASIALVALGLRRLYQSGRLRTLQKPTE